MNTRQLLALFVLICLAPSAFAQEAKPQKLDMTPTWKKGDRIFLRRVKEKFSVVQGKLVPQSKGVAVVIIEVLEKTDKGSKISWTSQGKSAEAARNPNSPDVNPIMQKLLALTQNARVIFSTDALGRPQKLENSEEIIKFYTDVSTKLEAWMTTKKYPKEMIQGTLQNLTLYTNPQTLPLVALRDPLVYFMRFESITKGEPVVKDVSFPNPTDKTGENPFPAKSSVQLVQVEGDLDYVEYKQTLDQKGANAILLKAMQEEAISMGQPLPTAKQVPAFFLQNIVRMRYNRKTGFPVDMSNVQTNVAGPNGQVSTVGFQMLETKAVKPTSQPTSKPAKK